MSVKHPKLYIPTKSQFSHFIITRFNIWSLDITNTRPEGVPDKEWLSHRFRLFDTFTYPSVRGQKNQDFKWIVLFDVNTPGSFREKIDAYTDWNNFIPRFITSLDELPGIVSDETDETAKYLITTRLDNDDAIGVDFIELVQHQFSGQHFEFVNFSSGYVLHRDKLYLKTGFYSNPFISLVEKIGAFKTVYCGPHNKLYDLGTIRKIETKPLWLQIVHKHNISNRVRDSNMRVPTHLLNQDFTIRYKKKNESKWNPSIRFENIVKRIKLFPNRTIKKVKQQFQKSNSPKNL